MRWISQMLHALWRRIAEAPPLAREQLLLGAAAGVLLLVVTGWLLLRAAARLPADWFVRPQRRPAHPVLALLLVVARNLGGTLLFALGVVMVLPGVPGPGVATMVIGFLLLDFPGKRGLELRILRRPKLRATLDRLRARHGQPPLQLPGETSPRSTAP